MKIIQLVYSLSSGGAEKFVVNLSNELAQRGHSVTICMLREETNPKLVFNRQFLSTKINFCSLNLSAGFSFGKALMVEKFIRSQKPEVVHCHLNVIPYIYYLAFNNKDIKFFHTIHNIASKASGVKVQYWLNRFFYQKGFIIPVTISKECHKSFVDFYRLKNIICIDNGCPKIGPSNQFHSVVDEINSYKMDLNTFVFVHIARFHPQKNQRLLIDSFNRLAIENINYTLLIIGSGFLENVDCSLKKSDKIHFLGEKNNVGDYLLCADAFCLSSIYEGLPISLIEAISCGITPICTPVGGIPDVVSDGISGYLAKDCTVDSFCQAVKRFIDRPISKGFLIDYYKKNYSIEACAEKYEELFNNTISK